MTLATAVDLAQTAALLGDVARATMALTLMDGRARTATELAWVAGVKPQTASGHLAKLADAGLLAVEARGRFRYFRLADPAIGTAIESLLTVAAATPRGAARPLGHRDPAMRAARTCYDHLAGRLGVDIAEALVERGALLLTSDAYRPGPARALLHELGIPVDELATRDPAKPAYRRCLDCSERKPHLGGPAGAAMAASLIERGWVRQEKDRVVSVTDAGRTGLGGLLGIGFEELPAQPAGGRRAANAA